MTLLFPKITNRQKSIIVTFSIATTKGRTAFWLFCSSNIHLLNLKIFITPTSLKHVACVDLMVYLSVTKILLDAWNRMKRP